MRALGRSVPRTRRIAGERSAPGGVSLMMRRARHRRAMFRGVVVMTGVVRDLVDGDPGGEGARGEHDAQLDDQQPG
jgi:hypothetical protein